VRATSQRRGTNNVSPDCASVAICGPHEHTQREKSGFSAIAFPGDDAAGHSRIKIQRAAFDLENTGKVI